MYTFTENHIADEWQDRAYNLYFLAPVLCSFKPQSCYPRAVLCLSVSLFPGYDSSTPSQVNVARAVGEKVMKSMAESLGIMCLASPMSPC